MTTMFAVGRDDLRRTQWLETPPVALRPGEARLRIDLFALTANNVTYGAFGEAMHYWDFFPTGDAETGCIPVWGFATVSESLRRRRRRRRALLRLLADGRRGRSRAGARHRRGLLRRRAASSRACPRSTTATCAAAAIRLYRREHESLRALLQPLFITSFLIDDFLADNEFFGASTVLVSSASSKTAYGLGFCLARRRGQPGAPKVVGLTSPANLAFTRELGCYDDVVAYDDVTTLPAGDRAVYVDMSGDARCERPSTGTGATDSPTAAPSAARTGRRSAAARGCQGRGRCCSSRPRRSRSASPSGARAASQERARVGVARLHRARCRCADAVAAGRFRATGAMRCSRRMRSSSTGASPRRKAGCSRCDPGETGGHPRSTDGPVASLARREAGSRDCR